MRYGELLLLIDGIPVEILKRADVLSESDFNAVADRLALAAQKLRAVAGTTVRPEIGPAQHPLQRRGRAA